MASRREPIHRWVAEELPRHLEMLGVPGEAELMSQSIRPLVRGLFAAIVGVDLPPHLMLDNISQVFDKSISVKRRRLLEDDMRALETHIRATLGAGCDEEEVRLRLGLLVVGKDTTVGTLGECLVQLLRDFPDTPLNRITYPKAPAQTGLPFVERIASGPVTVGGVELKEGDRVRVVLQTFVDAPPAQHHRLFGAGPHACLGRPLTVDLWAAICRHMSGLDTRLKVLDYELPQNEYVFNVAKTFRVEVSR
jgi:cytochrome P450